MKKRRTTKKVWKSSVKRIKTPPRPKQQSRKVNRPIKPLKRSRYRGTAEARKLKERWMNQLQKMVGDIPIDWNLAAMYYDQGLPVPAAFQKLVQKQETKGESMKTEKRTFKSFKEFAQSLDIVEDTVNFDVIDDSNTLKQAKKMVKEIKESGGVVWVDLTSGKPNVNQSSTKEEFESDAGGDDAVDKGEIFIVYKNL